MSRRTNFPEGGFEAVLTMSSLNVIGLVYLKTCIKGTNVFMFFDTGATNSFMTPKCAKRLGLVVDSTALPINEFCARIVRDNESRQKATI
jgi:predicted aspartyl protease